MNSIRGTVMALGLLVALGAAAAWLQDWTLANHIETVDIPAPVATGADGVVTREQIAAYEDALARCEASGARCRTIVVVEGMVRPGAASDRPPGGWLPTPAAVSR